MKRILLVDDLRVFRMPKDDTAHLFIARTSKQALTVLAREDDFDEIWLDHDLGMVDGQVDDVMHVIDYLSERSFHKDPVRVGIVYVHTSNPAGAVPMLAALERFEYNAQRIAPEAHFIVTDSPADEQ